MRAPLGYLVCLPTLCVGCAAAGTPVGVSPGAVHEEAPCENTTAAVVFADGEAGPEAAATPIPVTAQAPASPQTSREFVSREAPADTFYATRSEKLVEAAHAIRVVVSKTHAKLIVRRDFFNGGKRHDQAVAHIFTRASFVPTGLRTLAMKNGAPHWYDGKLLEAELAARRYRELTGLGGYYPKDPALLSWRSQGHYALQVFPCEPGKSKSVEYTLSAPVEYADGRYGFSLPVLGTDKVLPSVSVTSADKRDQLWVNGRAVNSGVQLGTQTKPIHIELAAKRPKRIASTMALAQLAPNKSMARWSVELAPQISKKPKGAYVAIVLDDSRSLDDSDRAAQATVAINYLEHLPDAHVRVFSYHRNVTTHHRSFVSAKTAIEDLRGLTLSGKNGSATDLALARADRALRAAPATAPRRVLLLTDTLTKRAVTTKSLKRSLKSSRALLHVVAPREGTANLLRDDVHAWAKITRPTGGLVWSASAPQVAGDDDASRAAFLELVRPTRLHRARLDGAPDVTAFPSELDEGQAHSETFVGDLRGVKQLTLHGELWANPVTHRIRPSRRATEIWSALIFGTSHLSNITEKEMMPLAMRGGAVSPVTSYLAIEPGVRPSTAGLEDAESGMGGLGLVGVGSGSGGSARGVGGTSHSALRNLIADAWRICSGTGQLTASLELTRAEIAEVGSVRASTDKSKAHIRCVRLKLWDIQAPAQYRSVEHQSLTLKTDA